ncbi:MAG: TIGR00282 family metallophosphoesterase [Candidatus Omnitrophota bacterium]|jgi:metallophosphoesterase (TIGR00282 family)
MNVLFIGDIVGRPGREIIRDLLPGLKKEFTLDFVIANTENAAGGSGITPGIVEELVGYGIDAFTSGDHIFKKRDVLSIINQEPRLLRPANFPLACPGKGAGVFKIDNHQSMALINIIGRVFMEPRECPFRVVKEEIDKAESKIIIVDFHAEATSEKVAMGWYLDGLVSAVLGTHTHIQTADEKILPKGTAYITDVGMTGPQHSVIGRRVEDVIARFITQVDRRFEVAAEDIQLQGVILDIDENTGRARSISRIQRRARLKN